MIGAAQVTAEFMYLWIYHIINQDFSPCSFQISSHRSIFDDEIKCLKGRDDEAEFWRYNIIIRIRCWQRLNKIKKGNK